MCPELRKDQHMEENKNSNPETLEEGQDAAPKTYTQEEVDALLQQETDRRVTSALKKAQEKNAKKVKEAEKLAQMDAQQRYEYELQQREAAIAEKERQLTIAENTAEASKILANKGLSADLVQLVVAEDAETMQANIATLERAFKASVKEEVTKRLGSNAPKRDLPLDKPVTLEEFKKMGLVERQNLATNNPELYKQFTGRKEL